MKSQYLIIGLSIVCCQLISSYGFGQSNNSPGQVNSSVSNEDELLRKKWTDSEGTFQFQIINSRKQLSIPVETISLIEKNRHESNVVYLDYMEDVKLMILPKNVISKIDFKKLELFKYINE